MTLKIKYMATNKTGAAQTLAMLVLAMTQFCSLVAFASDTQQSKTIGVADIQQAALDWANTQGIFSTDGQRVEISKGKMDQRLLFNRCAAPLTFEQQQNQSRSSRTLVKVRCTDTQPWAIFVPLEIKRFQQVVVAAHNLARNTAIGIQDIRLKEVALNRPSNYWFNETEMVLGMVTKRNLRVDQPLSTNDLRKPKLVKKGDSVVISATSGSITVRMQGTALSDGFRDQQIRVKNSSSERTIKAIVTGQGTVRAIM